MRLLGLFSVERTEMGLSELARMARLDKAATRRLLVALAKHGFIEQDPETRKYRLGTGFLRLARIRESTLPTAAICQSVVDWLTEMTNETAHASVRGAGALTTIAHREPIRGTIVHIDPGEALPFHATASGIAYLGFAPPAERDALLRGRLPSFTEYTPVDRAEILRRTDKAFAQGHCFSERGLEDEVSGVAVPFFGASGAVAGTVAVAMPPSRMTAARRSEVTTLLFEASWRITAALGGTAHPNVPAPRQPAEAAE